MSSPRERAAIFTVERSRASLAIRPARSALSQLRATTNCASVSDNFATSATRVAAGRSSSTSIDSRIAARWPWRSTIRSHENGASSAQAFSISSSAAAAEPTSAIAAQTEAGRLMRRAIAHCISPLPVATMSTRSASIRSGECSSTGSAIDAWSSDSACTMAAGASALRANTSAMAWRTNGEVSSSCIRSAPSAAARSSSDKSEINQARANARVASARSPAGAVLIQLMNCRTIIALPAYAT